MGPLPDPLLLQMCGHQEKFFSHSYPEAFSDFLCGGGETSRVYILPHVYLTFKHLQNTAPKATSCLSNLPEFVPLIMKA